MVEVTRIVAGTPVVEQKVVTATPVPPATAVAQYKIAAVFPKPIKDAAFSQSMYEALLVVQKEMGGEAKLKIAYSENMFQVPNAAAALRDYASQGYNLVIAHGSQYGTSLAQVAPDFPKVSSPGVPRSIRSNPKASAMCSPIKPKRKKAATCKV